MCNKEIKEGNHENNLTHKLANWIVFIAIITLLIIIVIGGITVCYNLSYNRIPATMTIKFHEDTLNISEGEIQTLKDSLNDIMLRREQILANKYQYIIEKRALEDSLASIGSTLIGIIIAILGFFGFKSFQSIENSIKETENAAREAENAARRAENKASEAAKEAAEQAKDKVENLIGIVAYQYLENNIRQQVKSVIILEHEKVLKNIMEESLKDNNIKIQEKIDELNESIKTIEELRENMVNLEIQIKNLQENVINTQTDNPVAQCMNNIDDNDSSEPTNKFLE